MVLENNLDGCTFEEVTFILVGKSNIPFFLFKPVCTFGYDAHFNAFEIKIDDSNAINLMELTGCYITDLFDTTPTVARTIGNFKMYATLRYAI